jgi:hypothetical protein
MIEIFKNPVVLGVLSGILLYVGMAWNLKNRKNKKNKRKQVKIHFPIIMAILVGIMAHYYFADNNIEYQEDNYNNKTIELVFMGGNKQQQLQQRPIMQSNIRNNLLIGGGLNRFNGLNGEFVTKGISIPSKIPDAFSTEHF